MHRVMGYLVVAALAPARGVCRGQRRVPLRLPRVTCHTKRVGPTPPAFISSTLVTYTRKDGIKRLPPIRLEDFTGARHVL